MEEILIDHGYLALFILSFLASTVIPLGSEWLLAALIVKGFDPAVSIGLATIGNTLGACTTYLIGLYGGDFLIKKALKIDDHSRRRAERIYSRYGSWSLLFSWLPVIGDPLCLIGGALKARFAFFFILVFAGKLARYVAVGIVSTKLATG
ncbi:MAG: DedA family protein [Desulfobacterales bacterium]|nr:DedA family protein [Deltaproteobacteria bacterium]NNL42510.1 DedA family protein [Desulfobacterales bacterium]